MGGEKTRFEEIVEKLYENYVKAVEKEEKIERVREIAKELGIEISDEIKFDSVTESAYYVTEINNDMLNEVLSWLIGKDYRIHKVELMIRVGFEMRGEGVSGSTQKRAEKMGLKYIGFYEFSNGYEDIFEVTDNVYLLVFNDRVVDDC